MSIWFINGSPNKCGNTVGLAKELLHGQHYETLHLVDYKIYSYGQRFSDDELITVLSAMKQADTIVIGSPVYWHNLSGAVRNLLDRLYGVLNKRDLAGKKLFLLYQGAGPQHWMIDSGEYTISTFARLYGLRYMGMATTISEAHNLSEQI